MAVRNRERLRVISTKVKDASLNDCRLQFRERTLVLGQQNTSLNSTP